MQQVKKKDSGAQFIDDLAVEGLKGLIWGAGLALGVFLVQRATAALVYGCPTDANN